MKNDNRQLRTPDNGTLIGYKGDYKGKRVLAIMKGTNEETWECIGAIDISQLVQQLNSGPGISLDNLI